MLVVTKSTYWDLRIGREPLRRKRDEVLMSEGDLPFENWHDLLGAATSMAP